MDEEEQKESEVEEKKLDTMEVVTSPGSPAKTETVQPVTSSSPVPIHHEDEEPAGEEQNTVKVEAEEVEPMELETSAESPVKAETEIESEKPVTVPPPILTPDEEQKSIIVEEKADVRKVRTRSGSPVKSSSGTQAAEPVNLPTAPPIPQEHKKPEDSRGLQQNTSNTSQTLLTTKSDTMKTEEKTKTVKVEEEKAKADSMKVEISSGAQVTAETATVTQPVQAVPALPQPSIPSTSGQDVVNNTDQAPTPTPSSNDAELAELKKEQQEKSQKGKVVAKPPAKPAVQSKTGKPTATATAAGSPTAKSNPSKFVNIKGTQVPPQEVSTVQTSTDPILIPTLPPVAVPPPKLRIIDVKCTTTRPSDWPVKSGKSKTSKPLVTPTPTTTPSTPVIAVKSTPKFVNIKGTQIPPLPQQVSTAQTSAERILLLPPVSPPKPSSPNIKGLTTKPSPAPKTPAGKSPTTKAAMQKNQSVTIRGAVPTPPPTPKRTTVGAQRGPAPVPQVRGKKPTALQQQKVLKVPFDPRTGQILQLQPELCPIVSETLATKIHGMPVGQIGVMTPRPLSPIKVNPDVVQTVQSLTTRVHALPVPSASTSTVTARKSVVPAIMSSSTPARKQSGATKQLANKAVGLGSAPVQHKSASQMLQHQQQQQAAQKAIPQLQQQQQEIFVVGDQRHIISQDMSSAIGALVEAPPIPVPIQVPALAAPLQAPAAPAKQGKKAPAKKNPATYPARKPESPTKSKPTATIKPTMSEDEAKSVKLRQALLVRIFDTIGIGSSYVL
jgi:hypothetical protein